MQGRELKEETTFGPDDIAVLIGHEETTSVVAVHLELKTRLRDNYLEKRREWGVEGMDPKPVTAEL